MKGKELPEGWEWKKLRDIATVSAGNGAPQGDEYFIDGKFPFVRTFDVGKEKANKNLVIIRDYINDRAVKEHGLQLFPEKTLLIPKSGASTFLNHRALLGTPAYVSSHLATVNAKNSILPEYLFFWSQLVDARTLTHDVNYPSLKLSEIESAQIPLPPLSVQRQIVAVLKQAEAVKRQRQAADALTGALLQSVFYEMFGDPVRNEKLWKIKRIKDVATVEKNVVNPDESNNSYQNYVGLENIEKETGRLIRSSETDSDEIKSAKFRFSKEHILYGKLRPYLNKVALPNFEGICSTDILTIKPIPTESTREFLCYLLRQKYFVDFANERSIGANLPRVSPNTILDFKAPIPPLALQQQFARVVEDVERIRERQAESKREIEGLFEGLMARSFAGELSTKNA